MGMNASKRMSVTQTKLQNEVLNENEKQLKLENGQLLSANQALTKEKNALIE